MKNGTTETKPRYLGLLNAISLAETHAGVYLRAWADSTCDEELACTLRLVAARETSHGELFCRRLCELGFDLRQKADPAAAERIAKYANPKISDLEKIGRARSEVDADPFAEIETRLKDGFYDPMTTNLLTWYICEERDSARRLREAYAGVRSKAGEGAPRATKGANGGQPSHTHEVSPDAAAIMTCMSDGFARLERKLEKIGARA